MLRIVAFLAAENHGAGELRVLEFMILNPAVRLDKPGKGRPQKAQKAQKAQNAFCFFVLFVPFVAIFFFDGNFDVRAP